MVDACRTYDLDGEPVTVRGERAMTDDEQNLLALVIEAARKHMEENPPPIRSVPKIAVGGRHASRIVLVATCPVHGVVGPGRVARSRCWDDANEHDAEHHAEVES